MRAQASKYSHSCATALIESPNHEQQSFVTNKKQQHWLWYAWEPRLKRIIAHTFGRRNKRTLCQLPALLSRFNVTF